MFPIKLYKLAIPERPKDEIFAIIDGFTDYMASDYGLIYCISQNRIMPTHYSWSRAKNAGKKYEVCVLKNSKGETKNGRVNRLVLMTFCPRPEYSGLEANHKNLITEDNRLCNLEWLDHLGNVQDYYMVSNSNVNDIWTNEKVHAICRLLELSIPYNEICNALNLPICDSVITYISAIRRGGIRKDISSLYNIPNKVRNCAILSDEEIHKVCELIIKGYSNNQIVEYLGYNYIPGSKETSSLLRIISRIRNKSRFTRISDQYF